MLLIRQVYNPGLIIMKSTMTFRSRISMISMPSLWPLENVHKVNDALSRVTNARAKFLTAELTTEGARQRLLEELHRKRLRGLLRRRKEALR
jgi:hypothetical protein